MKKQTSAAFLLAGTAIGSGMLSLPIVLAKFGLWMTCLWMLLSAGLTYLTALIRSDLNLNTFASATLQDVGQALDSPVLGHMGNACIKLLHFALMAAYIGGFASILVSLFALKEALLPILIVCSAMGFGCLFFLASKRLIAINKVLFLALFGSFLLLVVGLLARTPLHIFPSKTGTIMWGDYAELIPILFTSFGFQGSIHSMTKFCENDREMIRSACFWGSLLPAIIYCVWTGAILLVVANADGAFFKELVEGKPVALGALISVLSHAAATLHVQSVVWVVSLFALLTSILGVGLALLDILQEGHPTARRGVPKACAVGAVTVLPALMTLFWKNAFLSILNISGVILAVIAIIVPVLLSMTLRRRNGFKQRPLLKSRIALYSVLGCGVGIVVLGILEFLEH